MKVGVLAIQGAFEAHHRMLTALGASALYIKRASDVRAVSALVLPGGESTTMLKLLDADLKDALVEHISGGAPVLATCAGVILLATQVLSPEQESLHLLDVTVVRNGYGRQVDSFIAEELRWTEAGEKFSKQLIPSAPSSVEGVFIRAPRITRTGDGVETLIRHNDEAILVRQGSILGATFHPELTNDSTIHQLFLSLTL